MNFLIDIEVCDYYVDYNENDKGFLIKVEEWLNLIFILGLKFFLNKIGNINDLFII